MSHDTQPNSQQTQDLPAQPSPLDVLGADAIGVCASDLIDMIRNGNGSDVNELVRRSLRDRHAA